MTYLYGAGGHGKVVIEIAELSGVQIAGLVDADPAINRLLGYPVSTVLPIDEEALFTISIGDNRTRKDIVLKLGRRKFQTLIHLNTAISSRSRLAEGTVVMAGATINTDASIGKHCIINTNASIDHDCCIDDFVHISPNATLAGNVTVGEGTSIGIGACVIQNIKIGKWCTIGAGTIVIRDVPDGATVVGNPGRVIKTETSI